MENVERKSWFKIVYEKEILALTLKCFFVVSWRWKNEHSFEYFFQFAQMVEW